MKTYKDNLNTKNISEFTQKDTLYIQISTAPAPMLVLCQFVGFDNKSKKVSGKIIDIFVNESINKGLISKTITQYITKCALYGCSPENKDWGHFHWFDSQGCALDPKTVYKVTENNVHVSEHPSFGIVSVHRQHSTGTRLFGSSIEHSDVISLEISECEHKRSINNDTFVPKKHIINIEMSPVQFAELLTTLNSQGVPCTISWTKDDGYIPSPPLINKAQIFKNEFENRMHNFGVDLGSMAQKAKDLLEKAPNKGERQEILDIISKLIQEVKSNIPFVSRQFTEQMDSVVVEAKASFEAYIEGKIRSMGLEGFKEELKALNSGVIKEIKEINK